MMFLLLVGTHILLLHNQRLARHASSHSNQLDSSHNLLIIDNPMDDDAVAIEFQRLGAEIMRRDPDFVGSGVVADRRFRSYFGVSVDVCTQAWQLLLAQIGTLPKGALMVHLLWALMCMKLYTNETALASIAGGVDEKTFRKWSWFFIEELSYLETSVVSLFDSMPCLGDFF